MADWDRIKAGIFAGESGGDYDALFGFSNRPGGKFANTKLTGMTVDQAIQFADPNGPYAQWVRGQIGRTATPMGGFQVVGNTLKQAKNWAGLTGNEIMTPELQDRLGQAILAKQGTGAWAGYKGPREPAAFASADGPKGQEHWPQPYAPPDGPKGQESYPEPATAGLTDPRGALAAAAAPWWQKLAKGIGEMKPMQPMQGVAMNRPVPEAARLDQGEVPTIDPQAQQMQREQLAMAMQRLNSGRLF